MRADEFRESRWLRAGATAKQLTSLRAKHRRRSIEARATEGARIDGISDHDLRAELEPQIPVDPPEGQPTDGGPGPEEDGTDGEGDEGEPGGE